MNGINIGAARTKSTFKCQFFMLFHALHVWRSSHAIVCDVARRLSLRVIELVNLRAYRSVNESPERRALHDALSDRTSYRTRREHEPADNKGTHSHVFHMLRSLAHS